MKKPFVVGERVAVYAGSCMRRVGTVKKILGDEAIGVVFDPELGCSPSDEVRHFHPKQCRRLIPKKRRRVWLHYTPDNPGVPYYTHTGPIPCVLKNQAECHEFIEVVKKK